LKNPTDLEVFLPLLNSILALIRRGVFPDLKDVNELIEGLKSEYPSVSLHCFKVAFSLYLFSSSPIQKFITSLAVMKQKGRLENGVGSQDLKEDRESFSSSINTKAQGLSCSSSSIDISSIKQIASLMRNKELKEDIWYKIATDEGRSRLGFVLDIIESELRSFLEEKVDYLRNKKAFVFVGMGGSINTIKIMRKITDKKIIFLDTPDKEMIEEVIRDLQKKGISLKELEIIAISKSATTFETHAIVNILNEIYSQAKEDITQNLLWLIDLENEGKLKDKLKENGWEEERIAKLNITFIQIDKATDIGGRFTSPKTALFILPLFIHLDLDIERTIKVLRYIQQLEKDRAFEDRINEYVNLVIREKEVYPQVAIILPEKFKDFFEEITIWLTQLYQESLGGKVDGFDPKILVFLENQLEEKVENLLNRHRIIKLDYTFLDESNLIKNLIYLFLSLEYIVLGIAYKYSLKYEPLNFVNQPNVEVYKKKMKEIEELGLPQKIKLVSLESLIKTHLKENHKFIEIVYYGTNEEIYRKLNANRIIEDRFVLVFKGPDWNHHSFQAAYKAGHTLFLLLVDENTDKNVKLIAYATYQSLSDNKVDVIYKGVSSSSLKVKIDNEKIIITKEDLQEITFLKEYDIIREERPQINKALEDLSSSSPIDKKEKESANHLVFIYKSLSYSGYNRLIKEGRFKPVPPEAYLERMKHFRFVWEDDYVIHRGRLSFSGRLECAIWFKVYQGRRVLIRIMLPASIFLKEEVLLLTKDAKYYLDDLVGKYQKDIREALRDRNSSVSKELINMVDENSFKNKQYLDSLLSKKVFEKIDEFINSLEEIIIPADLINEYLKKIEEVILHYDSLEYREGMIAGYRKLRLSRLNLFSTSSTISAPGVGKGRLLKNLKITSSPIHSEEIVKQFLVKIRRSYDFRSKNADEELTEEVIEVWAKGLVKFQRGLLDKDKLVCVIGYDIRHSSERISAKLIDTLLNLGIDVIDIGLVTTPILYFATLYFDADLGIMITASHNPPHENGFKPVIKDKDSQRNPTTPEIRQITEFAKEILDTQEFVGFGREASLIKADNKEIIEKYVNMVIASNWAIGPKRWLKLQKEKPYKDLADEADEFIKERLKKEGLPLKGLKVVIDPGNGVAGLPAKMVLEKLGAQVYGINMRPDGSFPNHLPDPTVTKYMNQAYQKLKEAKADIAIGYDNDGDRIGAVAEINDKRFDFQGEHILGAFIDRILKEFPGAKIVVDVKMSDCIIEKVKELGGIPITFKTGHTNIKQKMRETGAVFGAEQSAHMYPAWFGKNGFFDDSIQASLLLLLALKEVNGGAQRLLNKLPEWQFSPDIRPPYSEKLLSEYKEDLKKIRKAVEKILINFAKERGFKFSTIDGIKIFFEEKGWALVRFSGTQKVLSTRVDAHSKENFNLIAKEIYSLLIEKEIADFSAEFDNKDYFEKEIKLLISSSPVIQIKQDKCYRIYYQNNELIIEEIPVLSIDGNDENLRKVLLTPEYNGSKKYINGVETYDLKEIEKIKFKHTKLFIEKLSSFSIITGNSSFFGIFDFLCKQIITFIKRSVKLAVYERGKSSSSISVATDIVEFLRHMKENYECITSLDIDPGLFRYEIQLSRQDIILIFKELLRNAVSKRDTCHIGISLSRTRCGGVSLVIKDDGEHINLERVKKAAIERGIFDNKIETVDEKSIGDLLFIEGFSVREYFSDGRGLALARNLVEKAGGRVSIENALPQGVKVIISFDFNINGSEILRNRQGQLTTFTSHGPPASSSTEKKIVSAVAQDFIFIYDIISELGVSAFDLWKAVKKSEKLLLGSDVNYYLRLVEKEGKVVHYISPSILNEFVHYSAVAQNKRHLNIALNHIRAYRYNQSNTRVNLALNVIDSLDMPLDGVAFAVTGDAALDMSNDRSDLDVIILGKDKDYLKKIVSKTEINLFWAAEPLSMPFDVYTFSLEDIRSFNANNPQDLKHIKNILHNSRYIAGDGSLYKKAKDILSYSYAQMLGKYFKQALALREKAEEKALKEGVITDKNIFAIEGEPVEFSSSSIISYLEKEFGQGKGIEFAFYLEWIPYTFKELAEKSGYENTIIKQIARIAVVFDMFGFRLLRRNFLNELYSDGKYVYMVDAGFDLGEPSFKPVSKYRQALSDFIGVQYKELAEECYVLHLNKIRTEYPTQSSLKKAIDEFLKGNIKASSSIDAVKNKPVLVIVDMYSEFIRHVENIKLFRAESLSPDLDKADNSSSPLKANLPLSSSTINTYSLQKVRLFLEKSNIFVLNKPDSSSLAFLNKPVFAKSQFYKELFARGPPSSSALNINGKKLGRFIIEVQKIKKRFHYAGHHFIEVFLIHPSLSRQKVIEALYNEGVKGMSRPFLDVTSYRRRKEAILQQIRPRFASNETREKIGNRDNFQRGSLSCMILLVLAGLDGGLGFSVFGLVVLAMAIGELFYFIRENNGKVDDNNHKKNNIQKNTFIHRLLFSASGNPYENYESHYSCEDIKNQKIHNFVFAIAANFAAIVRKIKVTAIPPMRVSQGILPEALGINTPTTKEPNNIFAPSRKKLETVLNSSEDNIQPHSIMPMGFVKAFCMTPLILAGLAIVGLVIGVVFGYFFSWAFTGLTQIFSDWSMPVTGVGAILAFGLGMVTFNKYEGDGVQPSYELLNGIELQKEDIEEINENGDGSNLCKDLDPARFRSPVEKEGINGRVFLSLFDGAQSKLLLKRLLRLLKQILSLSLFFTSLFRENDYTTKDKYNTQDTNRNLPESRKLFKKVTCQPDYKDSFVQICYCLGNKLYFLFIPYFHLFQKYCRLRTLSRSLSKELSSSFRSKVSLYPLRVPIEFIKQIIPQRTEAKVILPEDNRYKIKRATRGRFTGKQREVLINRLDELTNITRLGPPVVNSTELPEITLIITTNLKSTQRNISLELKEKNGSLEYRPSLNQRLNRLLKLIKGYTQNMQPRSNSISFLKLLSKTIFAVLTFLVFTFSNIQPSLAHKFDTFNNKLEVTVEKWIPKNPVENTLSGIAWDINKTRRSLGEPISPLYGKDGMVEKIARENNISNPDKIYVEQKIYVSDLSEKVLERLIKKKSTEEKRIQEKYRKGLTKKLPREIKRLQEEKNQLEREVSGLKGVRENLKTDIEKLRKDIRRLENQKTTLEKEIEKLKRKKKELIKLPWYKDKRILFGIVASIAAFLLGLKLGKRKMKETKERLAKIREKEEEIARRKKEIQEKEKKYQELEKQLEEANKKIQELEKAIEAKEEEKTKTLEKQRKIYEEEIEKLRKKIRDLETQLKKAPKEIESLREQITNLTKEIENFKTLLKKDIRTKLEEYLKGEIRTFEDRLKEINSQKELAQENINEAKRVVDDIQGLARKMQENIKEVEDILKKYPHIKQIQELTEEIYQINKEIEDKLEGSKRNLIRLSEAKNQIDTQIEKVISTVDRLKGLQPTKIAFDELEEILFESQRVFDEAAIEISNLLSQIQDIKQEEENVLIDIKNEFNIVKNRIEEAKKLPFRKNQFITFPIYFKRHFPYFYKFSYFMLFIELFLFYP